MPARRSVKPLTFPPAKRTSRPTFPRYVQRVLDREDGPPRQRSTSAVFRPSSGSARRAPRPPPERVSQWPVAQAGAGFAPPPPGAGVTAPPLPVAPPPGGAGVAGAAGGGRAGGGGGGRDGAAVARRAAAGGGRRRGRGGSGRRGSRGGCRAGERGHRAEARARGARRPRDRAAHAGGEMAGPREAAVVGGDGRRGG